MSVTEPGGRAPGGPEPAEEALIESALAGDPSAFEALVRRSQKRIYRVALAILRDEADADEVTQDTFVQAYLNLRSFERRAGLETWLTRIAINRARDVIRGRRVRLARLAAVGPETDRLPEGRPDAEREAMSAELRAAIERSVESLSAQQKVVFRMKHYEDRSLEGIASSLGLEAGTVRVHLFRAVHKIRKDLKGWLPGRATVSGE
jgi:RNA polymerase sigma-70 factor (ECF subfamily)